MTSPEADGPRAELTLAVLVGGRAERLGGRLKPLGTVDGEPLAGRILDALGADVKDRFLVAPAALAPAFASLGRVVEDPGAGPGPAVRAGALAARTPWLLAVAGDHVAPSRALAARLWAARAGHEAVVVREAGRMQGGFALYQVAAVRAVEPPRPFSLWRLLAALRTATIDADALTEAERRGLTDVDTEADAARHGVELPG